MTLGEYILNYREKHDISQRQFARMTGLSNSYISMLEKGLNPSSGKPIIPTMLAFNNIANAMNMSLDELFSVVDDTPVDTGGYSPSLPSNLRPMSAMPRHRVRKLGRIAAGVPILAEEDYGIYVDAPEKADYALEIEGDSMEPDYLDGDTIYIRQQPDVHDGGVAVVLVDDSATLKRVYHLRDGLQLVSNNPKYPPMRVSFDEHNAIRILGIVVGYTRMYRSRT